MCEFAVHPIRMFTSDAMFSLLRAELGEYIDATTDVPCGEYFAELCVVYSTLQTTLTSEYRTGCAVTYRTRQLLQALDRWLSAETTPEGRANTQ